MPRGGKRPGAGRKPKVAAEAAAALPPKEIIEQAARMAEVGITPDRVLRELASIGFAKLGDVVRWGSIETGVDIDEDADTMQVRVSNLVALVDSDRLDPGTAAAISEISQTKDGALRVKMHSKQPALLALAKHLGLFNPKQSAAHPEDPADVPAKSDDPWANLLPH